MKTIEEERPKYYNFETMFTSLKNQLLEFLKLYGFYFEISQNDKYYHFEILASKAGAEQINCFLDSVTISEY